MKTKMYYLPSLQQVLASFEHNTLLPIFYRLNKSNFKRSPKLIEIIFF